MNPFKWFLEFDSKTVDIIEEYCHRLERQLGVSHYLWLKLCVVMHTMLVYWYTVPRDGYDTLINVAYVFVATSLVGALHVWEWVCRDRQAKGLKNLYRDTDIAVTLRWMFLYIKLPVFTLICLAVFITNPELLGSLVWSLFVFVTVVSLIVLPACNPLPRTTSFQAR